MSWHAWMTAVDTLLLREMNVSIQDVMSGADHSVRALQALCSKGETPEEFVNRYRRLCRSTAHAPT